MAIQESPKANFSTCSIEVFSAIEINQKYICHYKKKKKSRVFPIHVIYLTTFNNNKIKPMGNTGLIFINALCTKKNMLKNAEKMFCWREDTEHLVISEKSKRAPSGVDSEINTGFRF